MIATQREDLRAKFTGTPEMVERFFLAVAEDLRRELAAIGARSVGAIVGESRRTLRPSVPRARSSRRSSAAPSWGADARPSCRPDTLPARTVRHAPASPLEARVAAAFRDQGPVAASGLRLSTADRSFGAGLTGALERGELRGPVRLELRGAAGQSFGAFAGPGVELTPGRSGERLRGQGSFGRPRHDRPEPDLAADPSGEAIAGNTILYGATGGRLHLVGRAGMRFAVRNSGADAVVEGIGPHGCEYMTGGTVVVLGPVGANFGAGMTGGRAYLYDPSGRHAAALNTASVVATRLSAILHEREDGTERIASCAACSTTIGRPGPASPRRLLELDDLPATFWVVEPVAQPSVADAVPTARPVPVSAPSPPSRPATRPWIRASPWSSRRSAQGGQRTFGLGQVERSCPADSRRIRSKDSGPRSRWIPTRS